jgi:beta-phosphoglucomutase
MKIKACIFDLDGVIVDTAKFHYLAWKALADSLGIPFNEHDNEQLKGVSRMTSLEFILRKGNKKYTTEEKNEMAARKNEQYLALCATLTASDILPGITQFLETLKEKRIHIGLGSASKNARMILDKLNLTSYFECIVDGNKISEAKPNPQVFLKAAEELNTLPDHAVVFEDAEAGVEAGIRGGFYVVGIGDENILGKADIVLSSTDQLRMDLFESFT